MRIMLHFLNIDTKNPPERQIFLGTLYTFIENTYSFRGEKIKVTGNAEVEFRSKKTMVKL